MVEIKPQTLTLANGERLNFRSLQRDDVTRFSAYLASLSSETRGKFRPHDFSLEVAQRLCEGLAEDKTLRFVVHQETTDEIIGYFLLHPVLTLDDKQRYTTYGISLNDETDGQFAPSLADAYQNSGLASLLMPSLMAVAKQLGFQRLILLGGVYSSNVQAIRFYEKQGFHNVGSFDPGEHKERRFDMMLALT